MSNTEVREETVYLVQSPTGLYAKHPGTGLSESTIHDSNNRLFVADPLEARRYESLADARASKVAYERWAGRLQTGAVDGYQVVAQRVTAIFYPTTPVEEIPF